MKISTFLIPISNFKIARLTLIFSCVFLYFPLLNAQETKQHPLKLWYKQPANYFEEALALGNGKIGATVYGGTKTDLIHLNDITLWSGGPVDPYMNPKAYEYFPKVRELLLKKITKQQTLW